MLDLNFHHQVELDLVDYAHSLQVQTLKLEHLKLLFQTKILLLIKLKSVKLFLKETPRNKIAKLLKENSQLEERSQSLKNIMILLKEKRFQRNVDREHLKQDQEPKFAIIIKEELKFQLLPVVNK